MVLYSSKLPKYSEKTKKASGISFNLNRAQGQYCLIQYKHVSHTKSVHVRYV